MVNGYCYDHLLNATHLFRIPESGPRFTKNLTTNRNRISYLITFSYVYDFVVRFLVKRGPASAQDAHLLICFGDKTTIKFQYIHHIAFWLLENSTTLLALNK